MKKIVCALAILAAASTAAVAKDVKQDQKAAPAVSATQMTDSEMDKVTGATAVTVGNAQLSLDLLTGQRSTSAYITNPGISRCVGSASACFPLP
jgi:opacity protein-like surface antigen